MKAGKTVYAERLVIRTAEGSFAIFPHGDKVGCIPFDAKREVILDPKISEDEKKLFKKKERRG